MNSCLQKKGSILSYHYNTPWKLHDNFMLFIDDKGKDKNDHLHDDDRLKVHNAPLLAI
jgi:hypothetical protein